MLAHNKAKNPLFRGSIKPHVDREPDHYMGKRKDGMKCNKKCIKYSMYCSNHIEGLKKDVKPKKGNPEGEL
jgi:hypothetical protein